MNKKLEFYKASPLSETLIPYFDAGLMAGFPSPADDYSELKIDLNRELIKNQDATFFAKVKGKSMQDAGLNEGDILVIDRSIEAQNGKVVVCFIDSGFTVKRIKVLKDRCWLMPENSEFEPIEVTKDNDFIIWGVVTYIIKAI